LVNHIRENFLHQKSRALSDATFGKNYVIYIERKSNKKEIL